MAGARFLAVAAALCALTSAFEAEEHKLLGDVGSQNALKRFQGVVDGFSLLKSGPSNSAPGDNVRLITRQALSEMVNLHGRAKQFVKEAFYPHHSTDAHLEATSPLLVWTGLGVERIVLGETAPDGNYFTFGDLVGAYGDVYRTMTCSALKPGNCRLGDNLNQFNAARREAVRDLLAGKDILTRTAFAAAALKKDDAMARFNRDGDNSDDALVLQELRLAFTNANHFSSVALQWYAAHHKQALLNIAKAAEAKVKGKKRTPNYHFMTAMHHEATGLHSLTDLFAPGHIVTDRAKSSADILANDKASNTDFPVWQSTVLNTAPLGAALTPVPHPLQDAAYVSPGTYSMIAKSEESLHTDFNEGGAIVRNLKTLLKVRKNSVQNDKKQIIEDYLKHFGNLHDDITTGVSPNDGSWRAFGDKRLFFYSNIELNTDGSSPVPRLNPGHAEWASAAVEDSVASLLWAYQELSKLKATDDFMAKANELAHKPIFWEALADIPLQVSNLCMYRTKRAHCFAPSKKGDARTFQYVPYKNDILDYLGVPHGVLPDDVTFTPCTANLKIDPSGWKCGVEPKSEWFGDTEEHHAKDEAKALKPNARFMERHEEEEADEAEGEHRFREEEAAAAELAAAQAAAAQRFQRKAATSPADAAHKTAVELAGHARTLVDNAEAIPARLRRNRNAE